MKKRVLSAPRCLMLCTVTMCLLLSFCSRESEKDRVESELSQIVSDETGGTGMVELLQLGTSELDPGDTSGVVASVRAIDEDAAYIAQARLEVGPQKQVVVFPIGRSKEHGGLDYSTFRRLVRGLTEPAQESSTEIAEPEEPPLAEDEVLVRVKGALLCPNPDAEIRKSGILEKVESGTRLKILERRKNWLLVEDPDSERRGWILEALTSGETAVFAALKRNDQIPTLVLYVNLRTGFIGPIAGQIPPQERENYVSTLVPGNAIYWAAGDPGMPGVPAPRMGGFLNATIEGPLEVGKIYIVDNSFVLRELGAADTPG